MAQIILIAAVAKNGVIGNNGSIPWHLSKDLKYFRMLTTGHPCIMGRTTYESLKKPLPNRENIVLTRDEEFLYRLHPDGVSAASSIGEALEYAEGDNRIFVIGGEQTYRAAMPFADRLEITRLEQKFEGDTFFPHVPLGHNVLVSVEREDVDQNTGEILKFRHETHYLTNPSRLPMADDVATSLVLNSREIECVRSWRLDPDSIAPKFTKAEEADFRKKLERLGLDHEAILGLEYK